MGEAAFAAALEAVNLPEQSPEESSISLEQAVQVVVGNTVAVLTRFPEKKAEWWQALGQMQAQVEAGGNADFAAFLGVVRQLVEGAAPERLTPQVPEEFQEAWQAILDGIPRQE